MLVWRANLQSWIVPKELEGTLDSGTPVTIVNRIVGRLRLSICGGVGGRVDMGSQVASNS